MCCENGFNFGSLELPNTLYRLLQHVKGNEGTDLCLKKKILKSLIYENRLLNNLVPSTIVRLDFVTTLKSVIKENNVFG